MLHAARASSALALTCSLLVAATPGRAADSDAKALAIAARAMDALGGEAAWKATRHLRFDFAVDREGKQVMRREHTWDKWTGRYRVTAKDKEGRDVVVAMNLNTKQGEASVAGKALSGEELRQALENAYAWWVNDSYWLVMPYKMRDPGVVLSHAGRAQEGEQAWDKVLLSFDNVGLTPKDKYWVFVNAKTGLVDRWEFVLKGEKTPPVRFDWRGWKPYGKIQLANDRVNPKDGTRIHFPVLDAPASVPDAAYTLAGK